MLHVSDSKRGVARKRGGARSTLFILYCNNSNFTQIIRSLNLFIVLFDSCFPYLYEIMVVITEYC